MSDSRSVTEEWDRNAAAWSSCIADGLDVINERFGIPRFLDYLGPIEGIEILDAGCGEGRSSRHLAAGGARVTGVDVSPEMIAKAFSRESEKPGSERITYRQASCTDLGCFPEERFDLVTSFMALMDTPDIAKVVGEFYRVTKPGGGIAIMVRHPCFFTPGFSVFKSPDGQRSGLAVSRYFTSEPYRERWKFPGQKSGAFVVTRFPYTLSDYLHSMLAHGFRIRSVSEPRPTDDACSRLPNLKFWQQHAALYLFISGTKP